MPDRIDSSIAQTGDDFYIVVDVETAGPTPGAHALLSIGACTLGEPRQTFYIELQPDAAEVVEEAMQINKLSLETLRREGLPPREALAQFASWIDHMRPENSKAVFTAFNAPFDWMFVHHYFHKYLGFNPFGHKALDIKAYYMGVYGVSWSETSHNTVSAKLTHNRQLPHHALQDAILEAELFELILAESLKRAHKEPEHEGTDQPQ
jgi:DNA polymerase III epsilon subunit-like protein